jgi:ribosomal protein S18 acetylase RimI-like enzyme
MNSITQHIRPANSTDAAMLQVLVRDCVGAMRAAGIEQWDEVYPNAKTIARDMEAGTLHILEDGKSIVASITIDQYLDPLWQGMDWTGDSEPAAAVHRLMVHPSQQGRGLAKMLMLHAETVARELGCRSIRLDSFLQNPAAMALYPLLGYRQTGTAMMRKGEFAGFEKVLPIRAMASAHIPAALELWRHTEGIGLTLDETPEMLAAFLQRNLGVSSVAVIDGRLVGAVLGGHDGRRGYIYHLAVDPKHRGCGIARSLVDRTVSQLRAHGLLKATIMVYATNAEGQSFWHHLGWRPRLDLLPLQTTL